MEKPIITTNIDGLLIKHSAFVEPHRKWFERAIKKTGDESLRKYIGADPYFPGVNIAMEKIMPDATPEQRTAQARTWYQKDVIKYLKEHPETIKKDAAKKLKALKEKYRLILLTTNTRDYINKIIEVSHLHGIYDDIIASSTEKEPDREKLIKELIEQYGKPKYYITGKEDSKTIKRFKSLGTKIITEGDIDEIN
ncbi:HAD hydrolase-like protein [Candidatus Pacearchaeota archaeon]|nr:HAD hydrolase-like protein [Candidatus Pacearchaeota archaeon]